MLDLFRYDFMVHAFEAGTIVAVVAGAIGYFVVLRGSAFAAHALSHIGFAGATGAVVLGLSPIIGLLVFTVGSGVAIGALGNRIRGRDVTIGIVLAWTLALSPIISSISALGVSGRNAAKSLSKTNVVLYCGFRTPPARAFPGHK